MSKARIKRAEPEYTGGGIYVIYGELTDGTYFYGDLDFYWTSIFDSDPRQTGEDELGPGADFFKEHEIKDLSEAESLDILQRACEWVIRNKPTGGACNYALSEIESNLYELKQYRKDIKE